MSLTHFRFLQAGSLDLDRPLAGFAEPPEVLAELLIDAPYIAAQKVFDTAVEERVDFLVLTGDLVDLREASPRAIAFLLENFERLDKQGIATYWAGGRLDPPHEWPTAARLPGGVQVFPTVEAEELSHFRGDRPMATILGRSWHGTSSSGIEPRRADGGLPTIVVGYGEPPDSGPLAPRAEAAPTEQAIPKDLVSRSETTTKDLASRSETTTPASQRTTYWALGGRTTRHSLAGPQRIVHYAGGPQGRSPAEGGPHGCTLVHVGGDGSIRSQVVATDAVRWHTEKLAIEDNATLESLRQQLAERAEKLRTAAESRPLIVTWQLAGGQHLAGPAARRDLAAEWQAWLRKEFSSASGTSATSATSATSDKPIVWTHAVELDPPELPDSWFEEESMLGDFLRNLRELAALDKSQVDLSEHIPERHRTPELAALAEWTEEEHRAVLYEAALSGAQLLGAGERSP